MTVFRQFRIGDRVEKRRGYRWPGEVRSVLTTRAGEVRLVVECTAKAVAGALHIYAPRQLRHRGRGTATTDATGPARTGRASRKAAAKKRPSDGV